MIGLEFKDTMVLEPVVLSYIQCLPLAIFQQNNVRPHVVLNQIELLPLPACSPDLLPFKNMWFILAQRLAWNTPPAATSDQLWQYVEVTWTAVPQGYIQRLFDSMWMHLAAVIANNGGYANY
ncbi:transposable element Tcb1 transposase [Trichonephila clavipes]|nr:transposable element Tcb1 transposase [Trichonephila clavipes]